MATTVDDLKSPRGEFTVEMFPELEEDLGRFEQLLAGFVEQGATRATAVGLSDGTTSFDRAVRAWATYRGADDILNRMLTTPISVDFRDKGQASYSPTQFKLWADKVAKYAAEFQAEVDLLSTEVVQRFSPTGHVRHRISLG